MLLKIEVLVQDMHSGYLRALSTVSKFKSSMYIIEDYLVWTIREIPSFKAIIEGMQREILQNDEMSKCKEYDLESFLVTKRFHPSSKSRKA